MKRPSLVGGFFFADFFFFFLCTALYFVWDKPAIDVPQTKNGQKVSIVELFGWPYADVAKECEFLGKAGWAGVKIFPSQGKKNNIYKYSV